MRRETARTRQILSQGYFVVEHPENEEDQEMFQSKLDVLRDTQTELVLEIEEEVEEDAREEPEPIPEKDNFAMDDSILDSWIVMDSANRNNRSTNLTQSREESILYVFYRLIITILIFPLEILKL